MVYLDNAATSFPKPESVVSAVTEFMRERGGNPGRSAHPLAMAAANTVFECREALAELFGAPGPDCAVLCGGCTAALNMAIKGLIPRGGHVLTSDLEHNSVRRPLERLRREGLAEYSVFHLLSRGRERPAAQVLAEMERLLRPATCAVVLTAAPNVCSVPVPLGQIGEFCRRHGLLLIADGAQAAGHRELRMDKLGISVLCVPGHKGLLGPQGVGAMLLNNGVRPVPLTEGGSGSASFDAEMPAEAPERYEAGTLPGPAIAGLTAGLKAVKAIGVPQIEKKERQLFLLCRSLLSEIPGVTVYAPDSPGSVLSFNYSRLPSDGVARALGSRDICVRGGLHCAPWAHEALGSAPSGSVRVSFSVNSTEGDVYALARALRELRADPCRIR